MYYTPTHVSYVRLFRPLSPQTSKTAPLPPNKFKVGSLRRSWRRCTPLPTEAHWPHLCAHSLILNGSHHLRAARRRVVLVTARKLAPLDLCQTGAADHVDRFPKRDDAGGDAAVHWPQEAHAPW